MARDGTKPRRGAWLLSSGSVPFTMEPAAAAATSQLSLWEDAGAAPAVNIRHSRRARRIAVRIAASGQVELVVPRGVAEHRALAFLHSQAEWVRRHVARR